MCSLLSQCIEWPFYFARRTITANNSSFLVYIIFTVRIYIIERCESTLNILNSLLVHFVFRQISLHVHRSRDCCDLLLRIIRYTVPTVVAADPTSAPILFNYYYYCFCIKVTPRSKLTGCNGMCIFVSYKCLDVNDSIRYTKRTSIKRQ